MSPPLPPNPPQPPVPPAPAPKPLPSNLSLVLLTAVVTAGVVLGAAGFGVWWFLHPKAPAPEPITISQLTPAHVGRRIQLHADTIGNLVKWQVISGPTPDNFDLWNQDAIGHDENLTAAVAGDYRVQAITVVGGEAYAAEIHVLVDVGPTPVPPIPPTPPPAPIPVGALRVLMTYDPDVSVTQGQLDVLKQAATQKLVPTGNWRVLPTDATFGDELPLWKGVFNKRKNKVGIVIFNGTDGSIVYEGDLPGSMADAQALIKKYGG